MPTGTVGSVARQYSYQMIHYLRKTIVFGDDAVEKSVGWVPAGALILPALSGAFVTTLFNGSTGDLIDIGVAGNSDLLATDLDVSSVGLKTLDEAAGLMLMTADTEIVAQYDDASSDATTGSAEIIIAYIPDNDG